MIARDTFRSGGDPNRGFGLELFPIDTETLRPVKPAARFNFHRDDVLFYYDQELDFRGSPFPGVQLRNSTALKFLGNIILCQESFVGAKILGQDTTNRNIRHAPQQTDIKEK
jgi:hypothetical protein